MISEGLRCSKGYEVADMDDIVLLDSVVSEMVASYERRQLR